jgi:hypothetical protein
MPKRTSPCRLSDKQNLLAAALMGVSGWPTKVPD